MNYNRSLIDVVATDFNPSVKIESSHLEPKIRRYRVIVEFTT